MAETKLSSNFIQNIIEDDLSQGKYTEGIHTRFPPEPNGYLHIGHVKSICLELYKAGMDGLSGDGYVVFGKDSDGEIDNQMIPWVQAEALIANLCAWKYQSISEGADYAMRIWDYIKDHLNDTVDTIAFRMYPMHDARACVQVMNIFR